MFAPRRLGASALAALAAPPDRLEAVAARVSHEPAINHNYQREHVFNLWFVVTAASEVQLREVVAGIERDTGCAVIVLPLEEEFHIDLGFDLRENGQLGVTSPERAFQTVQRSERDRMRPLGLARKRKINQHFIQNQMTRRVDLFLRWLFRHF